MEIIRLWPGPIFLKLEFSLGIPSSNKDAIDVNIVTFDNASHNLGCPVVSRVNFSELFCRPSAFLAPF